MGGIVPDVTVHASLQIINIRDTTGPWPLGRQTGYRSLEFRGRLARLQPICLLLYMTMHALFENVHMKRSRDRV